jgi:RsiW-degrading membrane proteinase PrsW (M82 family)
MNVRVKQGLMLVGWLLIVGLIIYASVTAPSDVILPPWTLLVLTDLLIELTLICVWIYWDSKRRGKNPWAWIIVSLILGAPGTLGYLLVRSLDKNAPPVFGSK